MRIVEIRRVDLISDQLVQSYLDDQRYGFNLNPVFGDDGVELKLIFDLLMPANNNQHVVFKVGTIFFLHGSDPVAFKEELSTLTGIVQTAMANTRLLLMQNHPELTNQPMKFFDSDYFIEEILAQITEAGI